MNKALWHDEIYNTSIYLKALPFSQPQLSVYNWSTDWRRQIPLHPPALSLFYYVWIRCFGDSEVSLHIPAAIAGAAGIILFYLLGSIMFDCDVAFMSALALTSCSAHIMYSVQTVHAIFEMLNLLASALVLAYFLTGPSPSLFRRLLILNAVGLLIGYYYIFFLWMQTVIFATRRKFLNISWVYFLVILMLTVLVLGFIKCSYDRGRYNFNHWPRNNFKQTLSNILYLPTGFTQ